jgi:hypothetical protein
LFTLELYDYLSQEDGDKTSDIHYEQLAELVDRKKRNVPIFSVGLILPDDGMTPLTPG